jgi:AraC-like DNA-binding protein
MHLEMRTEELRRSRYTTLQFQFIVPVGVLPAADEWPRCRVLASADVSRALFDHAAKLAAGKGSVSDALARNAVRQLLGVFLSAGERANNERPSELPPAVERALTFTKGLWAEHPLKSPSLDQLASAAGVSSGHLSRLFRDSLGVAPLGALRLLRLERAATDLATTARTIKEIAHQAGFESQFHFSRCFKKVFGDSPSAFRDRVAGTARRSDPPPSAVPSTADRWTSVASLVQ